MSDEVVYLYMIRLSDGFYYRQGHTTGQDVHKSSLYSEVTDDALKDLDHVIDNIDSGARLQAVKLEFF